MAFRDKTLAGSPRRDPMPCRRSASRAAVIAVAAFAAAPALAAPSTAGDDPAFAPSGLTSVAPINGRGYSLDATIGMLYDGNILRAGDDAVTRPGAERADFRFSPGVSGSIGLPVGRQQLFFGGQIGRDIYARNDRLNRNRYSVGGGINLRAGSRCQGTIAGDYNSRQALFSELSELVPNVQETLSYGATATCQSAAGLGFGGTVQRTERRNDSFSRRTFDVDTTVFAPNISYGRPNLGNFSIGGSYAKSRYPNRFVVVPDSGLEADGVDILSGRFGYSRTLGTRISLSAGVSYLEARPEPRAVIELVAPTVGVLVERGVFSGVGYDGSISYRAGPRLSASLDIGRNVQASANVGAQYQIQQNYGLGIDYQLGSAISLGTGVTYNQRDYRGSFASLDERGQRIQDKISRVYGSIRYSAVKLYSVGVELAYQNRESNPDQFSFGSFSALLTLRAHLGRES